MKSVISQILGLVALVLCLGGNTAQAERAVTVFAAASLGGVLEAVSEGYPDKVVFAFGGSGAMARQVASGAPADVVILANPVWADWLLAQGVSEASAVVIAQNRLAMIVPAGRSEAAQTQSIPEILHEGRLAMGQRDAVPAGAYARQWLQATGHWDSVSQQLAETDNVRAALALVARGDAPLGIVYVSDALAEPAVEILRIAPAHTHDPIRYPAIALTDQGTAFLNHLTRPAAQALFAARGFSATPPS